MKPTFSVVARSQRLSTDQAGNKAWRPVDSDVAVRPEQSAAVLCDVWDHHWCPAAERRLEIMLPAMDRTVRTLRQRGVMIVHAPSETMDHYANHPARERIRSTSPESVVPAAPALDLPPLPVSTGATEGCDATGEVRARRVWTRQHGGIAIDADHDLISDDGPEMHEYFRQRGITTVFMLGVHTNMCILNRSFALKALVAQGFTALLVRDLTDAMYDPADPPYVDHDAGTNLIVEYIEKFLCPTVTSPMLLA